MHLRKLNFVFYCNRTVVKINISKSGLLYSSVNKRSKDKNSALLTIGPVNIDIPQHPVVLHGMMTRSTKQLSNTLQVRSIKQYFLIPYY